MTKRRSEVRMAVFLAIAIVEHVIFILVLATVVYTEPVPKPDRPITVDIVPNVLPQEKRILDDKPVASMPVQPLVQDDLPPLRFTHNRQEYLIPSDLNDGLPETHQKRLANPKSDRFSLEIARPQGNKRDLVDNSPNTIVRAKPLVKTPGFHGPEPRKLPKADGGKFTRGAREQNSIGRLPAKSSIDTRISRIEGSGGDGNIRISGEVGGRKYRLPSAIQTEGKQGGSIQLSFKVKPDGTVDNNSVRIEFGPKTTVGEVRLKRKAIRYLVGIRFAALPKNVAQVNQSGEIFIEFSTQSSQ